jgi:4-oxalocrotonate tautomerase
MPIVRVELLAGRTEEQKAAAAEAITQAIARTLGVEPASAQVLFVDVERSNWAHGGTLFSRRAAPANGGVEQP